MKLIELADNLDDIDALMELDFASRKHLRALRELQKKLGVPDDPEKKRCLKRFILLMCAALFWFIITLVLAGTVGKNLPSLILNAMQIPIFFFVYFAFQAFVRMRQFQPPDIFEAADCLYTRMLNLPSEQLIQVRAALNADGLDGHEEEWDEENELWVFRDFTYGCLECGRIIHMDSGIFPPCCPHCDSSHLVFDSQAAPLTPELLSVLHDLFKEEN